MTEKTERIYLERVSCGEEATPKELRKYKMAGIPDSPVGTLDKWKSFAEPKSIKLVLLKEVR